MLVVFDIRVSVIVKWWLVGGWLWCWLGRWVIVCSWWLVVSIGWSVIGLGFIFTESGAAIESAVWASTSCVSGCEWFGGTITTWWLLSVWVMSVSVVFVTGDGWTIVWVIVSLISAYARVITCWL